jgi:Ca2+-binding EF-hand superfamily protein
MSAEDVESRVKAKVFPRRTRLKEFFRDYDKGRCGYITVPQFARALDLCQLELSSADIGLLAQKYQGTDQWGRVNYTEFAKCIDEVFVIEGLETMPSLTVSTGFGLNRSLSLGNTTAALSDADQDNVAAALDRLKEFVFTRKVLVKEFFRDNEHNQNSVMIAEHVTANQFANALMTLNMPVSPEETQLLCKKFDDRGDGTVNHRKFCAEVDDPSAWPCDPITGPPAPPHPPIFEPEVPVREWSTLPQTGKRQWKPSQRRVCCLTPRRAQVVPTPGVQLLLDKITTACRINGVRVHDFFQVRRRTHARGFLSQNAQTPVSAGQDFDKLRSNAIPHKKFVTGAATFTSRIWSRYSCCRFDRRGRCSVPPGLTMAIEKTGLGLVTESDLLAVAQVGARRSMLRCESKKSRAEHCT